MSVTNDFSLQGFSPADQARSIHTTLAATKKEDLEAYARNHKLLRLLERRSQMKFNVNGRGMIQAVQHAIHDLIPTSSVAGRNFYSKNLHLNKGLEYREYEMVDFVSERELLENQGDPALVKYVDKIIQRLKNSWGEQMNPQCYVNGGSSDASVSSNDNAGDRLRWQGIHTFMQHDAAFTSGKSTGYRWDQTTETAVAVDDANKTTILVMKPGTYYCGLNTTPYFYGGATETGSGNNFAEGQTTPDGDFWTPLQINTHTTRFGSIPSSGSNFAQYGVELIRYGIAMNRRNAKDAQIDTIMGDRVLVVDLMNRLSSTERSMVTSEYGLRKYGFKDVFEIDNVEVTTEYKVGTASVYRTDNTETKVPCLIGIPSKGITIMSMRDSLIEWRSPKEPDPDAKGWKYWGNSTGNFDWGSPRGYVLWAQFVAA